MVAWRKCADCCRGFLGDRKRGMKRTLDVAERQVAGVLVCREKWGIFQECKDQGRYQPNTWAKNFVTAWGHDQDSKNITSAVKTNLWNETNENLEWSRYILVLLYWCNTSGREEMCKIQHICETRPLIRFLGTMWGVPRLCSGKIPAMQGMKKVKEKIVWWG